MKLEVRVPISPRPYFFRQIEYLLRSILSCGGLTSDVRMVVSVGEDVAPYDIASLQPWSREHVIWRWVDRDAFRKESYHATGADRFLVESDADMILLADADILFIAGVDDLLKALGHAPAVAGVIAHVPPWYVHRQAASSWQQLFEAMGMRMPRDRFQHTGWGILFSDPSWRFSPAYFNLGAVFVPGSLMPGLARSFFVHLKKAAEGGVGYFKSQLALSMAVYDLDLPRVALDVRYNFPNYPGFDLAYPGDLQDVRIIHYMRAQIVNRQRIWETPESTAELLRRTDLQGSNEVLRRRIEHLVKNAAET